MESYEEYLLDKIDVMIENSIKSGGNIDEIPKEQKKKINNSKESVNNVNDNNRRLHVV